MFSKPRQPLYTCDVCEKNFTRKENLNQHLLKHVDFNFFHCHCGQSFPRYDSLQQHMLKHQSGGKRPLEENAMPKPKKLKENPKAFYDLQKIGEKRIPKFSTIKTTYKANVKDLEVHDLKNILKVLKTLFTSIMNDVTQFAEKNDLIRMAVQSPGLDWPILLPFFRKSELTADHFLGEIERVLQSFEEFVLDGDFEIDIIHVKNPKGGVMPNNFIDLDSFLKNKRCIIRIQNKDNLCCARAIVTAKAKIDNHPQYTNIRKGRTVQEDLARELHLKANVPLEECGIEEIKKFQSFLPDYQIHVVSREHFNAIIYAGPEVDNKIYLYSHDNHYDVITSMAAFLNRAYFCTSCNKGYSTKEEHGCNMTCHRCRKIHEITCDDKWFSCPDCNRFFQGQECFELHKQITNGGNSTCSSIYRCNDCNQLVNTKFYNTKHRCGEIYCKICKDFYPAGHECYMQPIRKDEEACEKTYIFFDFECTQDTLIQCEEGYCADSSTGKCSNCKKSDCGSLQHKPNCCIVHKVCSLCMNSKVNPESTCTKCGPNEIVFTGADTTDMFCKWLFSKRNRKAVVFCHNFKGYDSYPILKYLYTNGVIPSIIAQGSKNLSIEVPAFRIKFLDSINFLPTALKNLPKMFGIDELAKGYFPHLFNTDSNQYVQLNHLPDVSHYNPDSMKREEREQFLMWYEENKSNSFNMKDELVKYCRSDVDILRRSCLKFRELFMEIANVDPFNNCITIAAACMKVFRKNFLQENSIALIPAQGYQPEDKQSVSAIQWLKYIEHTEGHKIQHAYNGGEVKVGKYKLDGYYENERGEKIAMEYLGDFWHGNPKSYARETVNPVNGKTMDELYQATIEKQKFLENQGFKYRCIWESDWKQQISDSTDIKQFVSSLEITTALNPRRAFFGGRTETFKLYQDSSEDETIKYSDVTSLYPYINKYGKYPIGHPKRVFTDFKSIECYEGLVKCTVLPPRNLLMPVLPSIINNKLMFTLCRKCTEDSTHECFHNDKERVLTGEWVTDELKKALEKGYKILQIFEVWHFNETEQYDPDTKTGGLFTEYIDTFLKLKQEASGWPSWCQNEEDRQRYISNYFEKEGILLSYSNIKKNPGMRSLAKLMLNSFWGKFGQRSNMTQLEYFQEPQKYFDLLTSDSQEVTDVNFVSDEMVEMRWRYKEEFIETNSRTNVILAAYTTAQARLKLYEYLEELGPRALYADTDSVIYTTKTNEKPLQLGDYLGELTDEVPDGVITHFVSGGPKNYALKIQKANGVETITKVKGITLNFKTALKIDFDTVKYIIDHPTESVTTQNSVIRRQNKDKKLLTLTESKDYRIVFDKRVIEEGYTTLPYGY